MKFFSATINKIKVSVAKRELENELAKTIRLVESHKAVGLPAGHEHYKALRDRAINSIANYQQEVHNLEGKDVSYESIAVGIPALKEIEDMALPSTLPGKTVGLALASSFALTILVAILSAAYHDIFHLFTRLAH